MQASKEVTCSCQMLTGLSRGFKAVIQTYRKFLELDKTNLIRTNRVQIRSPKNQIFIASNPLSSTLT